MSILANYRRYAPFTADKLVDAVNSVLSIKGAQPITKRTLRFYTAQEVVAPPMGSPKFARYGYEHLLMLLGARARQDQGMKLDQIKVEVDEVKRGQYARMEQVVESWLGQAQVAQAQTASYDETEAGSLAGSEVVVRVRLTPNSVLEVSQNAPLRAELEAARDALQTLIAK